jgi:hypothetical protein
MTHLAKTCSLLVTGSPHGARRSIASSIGLRFRSSVSMVGLGHQHRRYAAVVRSFDCPRLASLGRDLVCLSTPRNPHFAGGGRVADGLPDAAAGRRFGRTGVSLNGG